jgi:Arc/MetJ-type ribon-helix-helix transcriptional regulator
MTQQIPIRIPDEKAEALDRLVEKGRFASRSEAMREGLDRLLAEEREREIEDAYRRAHERAPDDEAAGQAGLAAFSAWAESEGGEPL